MRHANDVAAQCIAQLASCLKDPALTEKQLRAFSRAISWLKDVTNPLSAEEQEKWNESNDLEGQASDFTTQDVVSEIEAGHTDEDRRDALEYLND